MIRRIILNYYISTCSTIETTYQIRSGLFTCVAKLTKMFLYRSIFVCKLTIYILFLNISNFAIRIKVNKRRQWRNVRNYRGSDQKVSLKIMVFNREMQKIAHRKYELYIVSLIYRWLNYPYHSIFTTPHISLSLSLSLSLLSLIW